MLSSSPSVVSRVVCLLASIGGASAAFSAPLVLRPSGRAQRPSSCWPHSRSFSLPTLSPPAVHHGLVMAATPASTWVCQAADGRWEWGAKLPPAIFCIGLNYRWESFSFGSLYLVSLASTTVRATPNLAALPSLCPSLSIPLLICLLSLASYGRAHATELGKPLPTEPVVFSKSPACLVPPGCSSPPPRTHAPAHPPNNASHDAACTHMDQTCHVVPVPPSRHFAETWPGSGHAASALTLGFVRRRHCPSTA